MLVLAMQFSKDDRSCRSCFMTTAALAIAFLSTEFQGKGFWLLAAGVTTLLQRDASGSTRTLRRPSMVGSA